MDVIRMWTPLITSQALRISPCRPSNSRATGPSLQFLVLLGGSVKETRTGVEIGMEDYKIFVLLQASKPSIEKSIKQRASASRSQKNHDTDDED